MKQPRNILCDKSAATVFYKAEGGKNVQEPLPEKDNELNEAARQKIIEKTPLHSHGDPVYIAQAVLALIDNPFVTGQVLRVDGGRSIG